MHIQLKNESVSHPFKDGKLLTRSPRAFSYERHGSPHPTFRLPRLPPSCILFIYYGMCSRCFPTVVVPFRSHCRTPVGRSVALFISTTTTTYNTYNFPPTLSTHRMRVRMCADLHMHAHNAPAPTHLVHTYTLYIKPHVAGLRCGRMMMLCDGLFLSHPQPSIHTQTMRHTKNRRHRR